MKLARAIHFDESDQRVFHSPAQTGEWCISGGFEFSNWTDSDLHGKARQSFANGWLGLQTFGRVTFVAVTQMEENELDVLVVALARHFVQFYGAPSIKAAENVARGEIMQMVELCDDHDANTLLTVARDLGDSGVHESFRASNSTEAGLEQFAVHGDVGDV